MDQPTLNSLGMLLALAGVIYTALSQRRATRERAAVDERIARETSAAKERADRLTADVQRDIAENDMRKAFVADVLSRLTTTEARIVFLEAELANERERHIKDLEQMRAERDQVRQEKHDQAEKFQATVLEYEHRIAEMQRCYDVKIQELTDMIRQLQEKVERYEQGNHEQHET